MVRTRSILKARNNQDNRVDLSSTTTSLDPVDHGMLSTEDGVQCTDSTNKRKQAGSVQKSWVWDHITKFTIKEKKEIEKDGKKETVEIPILKARCNYCAQVFVCDTSNGGTSSYRKHILKVCKKYKPTEDLKQKVLGGKIVVDGDVKSILVAKSWSQEESVKAIVDFIVIDEQPFNIVEKEGFRRMMSIVQPRLHVPCRRTIVREFWKVFDDMKDALRKELNKYRVSFTTDTWTSVQNLNYMVLTAHFIDDDWKMHKRILNFCPIPSHQGKEIGKLIEQCLLEWKIEKVLCISVDNAAANKVAIDWLVGKMKKWSNSPFVLDGKYMHVRCLAHIINLIVKDGLKKLDKSVASIRKAVKFVRSSPSRLDNFKQYIESERLDTKSLVVMDVPTRWNSTYLMLESCLKLRKAFDRMYDDEDNAYLSYFKDEVSDSEEEEAEEVAKQTKVRVGPPIDKDWEVAEVLCSFLRVFYLVTVKVSASKYPTSHTAVHDIIAVECEIYKFFQPEYLQTGSDVEKLLCDMGASMRGKYLKYFGSIGSTNQLFVIALVLDPRFKLRHYIHLCKKKLEFTDQQIEEEGKKVKTLMKELCDAYAENRDGPQRRLQKQVSSDSMTNTSSSSGIEVSRSMMSSDPLIFDEMMEDWEKELEATEDIVLSHDVDSYLADRLEPNDKNSKFDILNWWKHKGKSSYPTLALVAKDVLAIQVSTVASESAFSTGGRVIDPFRSSLTPKSVEGLICLQNWLKSEDIGNIEYEASASEMEFYRDLETEHRRGEREGGCSSLQT